MQNTIENLEARIVTLEAQLKAAKAHTYVNAVESIHAQDGEIHFAYNNQENWVVWNAQSLFEDLPSIINIVRTQQKEMTEMTIASIKEELNNL
jgi:uncharacterized protein YdiU (UPF0061 family)